MEMLKTIRLAGDPIGPCKEYHLETICWITATSIRSPGLQASQSSHAETTHAK